MHSSKYMGLGLIPNRLSLREIKSVWVQVRDYIQPRTGERIDSEFYYEVMFLSNFPATFLLDVSWKSEPNHRVISRHVIS